MPRVGRHTIWHNVSCPHWDIRRLATLPDIQPQQLPYLPDGNSTDVLYLESENGSGSYLWSHYRLSSFEALNGRLECFAKAFDGDPGYRRRSLDFTLDLDPAFLLKAYARPADKERIYVSAGCLLAVEEAAHILFSGTDPVFFNEGFDLWGETGEAAFPTAAVSCGARSPHDVLRDYSSAFGSFPDNPGIAAVTKEIRRANAQAGSLDGIPKLYAAPDEYGFLHMCFSRVALSSTRQSIADEFSALCAMWLIAHEDAHRYLGHLTHFFGPLGASTFDEFESLFDDPENAAQRRSSELAADSAAMQRQVDLAYKAEFIGMLFDSVDPNIRQRIWRGRSEKDGLDAWQRIFALRLIAGSAVTPLLLFEMSRLRSKAAPSEDYPPLFVRFLNLAFETFNRAIDTQTNHAAYGVGKIDDAGEVFDCFSGFLRDTQAAYSELTSFCVEDPGSEISRFPLGADPDEFFSPAMALRLTMLMAQMHGLNVSAIEKAPLGLMGITRHTYGQADGYLRVFLSAKRDAMLHATRQFAQSRRSANSGDKDRQRRIEEDLRREAANAAFLAELLGSRG